MLSVAEIMTWKSRMINELERVGKEVTLAYLQVLFQYFPNERPK